MPLVFEVVFLVEHLIHGEINFVASQFENILVEHVIHKGLSHSQSFDVLFRVHQVILFVVRPAEQNLEGKTNTMLSDFNFGKHRGCDPARCFERILENVRGSKRTVKIGTNRFLVASSRHVLRGCLREVVYEEINLVHFRQDMHFRRPPRSLDVTQILNVLVRLLSVIEIPRELFLVLEHVVAVCLANHGVFGLTSEERFRHGAEQA